MSPAYQLEEKALKLLYPNWETFDHGTKQAKWDIFMHNVAAAEEIGIVSFNYEDALTTHGITPK